MGFVAIESGLTQGLIVTLDREALRCETCQGWWRPDITWFGDALNERVVNSAREAITQCDLLVSIGTSAVVYPAAGFPRIAKRVGATLVEINLEDTAMSDIYDVKLRGPASEMLATMQG